ncbi:MAG: HAD family hydrolase [Canibacter sp.]
MSNSFEPAVGTTPKSSLSGFLFDLDGVLTPTVEIHMRAWEETFNDFFIANGHPAYQEHEYFETLDGRSRFDGVQTLLNSRGITLPWGSETDTELTTVCGIGNEKNRRFRVILDRDGIQPYPGSLALLDQLNSPKFKLAVVSSSRNAQQVLEVSGLAGRFQTVVDGNVAQEKQLAGKPAPDTYLYAAQQLGVDPSEAIVFEDALSGVAAGAAGNFAQVVGVNRGTGASALKQAGAHIVVSDLADLISSK